MDNNGHAAQAVTDTAGPLPSRLQRVFAGLGFRRKLALSFGLLMALVVIVAAGSIEGLNAVTASFETAIGRGLQLERLAGEMHIQLLEARRSEQMFLLHVKADGFATARENHVTANRMHRAELLASMARLEGLNRPDQSVPGYDRINDDLVALKPYVRVYGEDFDGIVEAIRSGAPDTEVAARLSSLASSVVVVEPLVADIAEAGRRQAGLAIAEAQATSRRTVFAVGASTAIALLVGLMLAWRLGTQIAAPLRLLASTAAAIRGGDLTARAAVVTKDEIGTLARSFNAMTDRVNQTLEELRRSEEKYRGIYEHSLDGIYQGSLDGRVLTANPALARMFGFDSPEALVAELTDVGKQVYVNAEERDAVLADLLRDGTLLGREVEVYRQDRQRFWISMNARIARDAAGKPQYVEAFINDITEQKRAGAERQARKVAEAANLAKSRFLASMSHELRTPLNAIMGFAQLLQLRREMNDDQRAQLELIYKSGEYLLALIDDILDLAKIEAGKLELYLQDVDTAEFLNTVIEVCRVRADAKRLSLRLDLPESLPTQIRIDERRLRQVLLNQLGNAIKFTEQGGVTLRVRSMTLRPETARVRFTVIDTGIGIGADKFESIFEPFEQAGNLAQRAAGTGLGLAISRQLVRAMGGDVRVSSRLGAGSEFSFELDIPVVASAAAQPAAHQMPIGYLGPRRKALVIDDVVENRQLLAMLLGGCDFEVFEADDGRVGVAAAQALKPDLILLDIRMPVMDGLQAMQLLRAHPTTQRATIIAISAGAFRSDIKQALAAGADAFLAKPLQVHELMAEIGHRMGLSWRYE